MNNIRNGVILAAGKGKRLNTNYKNILPKPLIPIGSKAIIDYAMENLMKFGVSEYYIIVHYKKDLIQRYLKNNYGNFKIHFIYQKTLSGIGDAIYLTKQYIQREPFIVQLGDEIDIVENLEDFNKIFYEKHPSVINGSIYEPDLNVLKRTCEVNSDVTGKILEMREKPMNPVYNHRGTGLYIFNDRIYEYIEKTPISSVRNEREITDTINIMSKDGNAYSIEMKGVSCNINTLDDLRNARNRIANYI
jgi:dTDP-glucose pyrophosphorylase